MMLQHARFAIIAVLCVAGLGLLQVRPAAAQTDISGFWKLTLSHPDIIGTILCTAGIDQQGSTLDVSMVCNSLGSGPHTGSITKATGAFTMSGSLGGQSTSFSGTATSNGSSMSGTWTISPIPATGTFTGTRNDIVGGIAELPAGAAPAPAQSAGPDGTNGWLIAGAASAICVAMVGGAWLAVARRRC